ncbi:hypothetical protein BaRGS_00004714 [Batillaria attramentaria]|uniref:Uncharacterized protein n=1 Tax=Batillaria attramentaria TaxID=370345 RepID=A0ABD0LYD6_9CAEN
MHNHDPQPHVTSHHRTQDGTELPCKKETMRAAPGSVSPAAVNPPEHAQRDWLSRTRPVSPPAPGPPGPASFQRHLSEFGLQGEATHVQATHKVTQTTLVCFAYTSGKYLFGVNAQTLRTTLHRQTSSSWVVPEDTDQQGRI